MIIPENKFCGEPCVILYVFKNAWNNVYKFEHRTGNQTLLCRWSCAALLAFWRYAGHILYKKITLAIFKKRRVQRHSIYLQMFVFQIKYIF